MKKRNVDYLLVEITGYADNYVSALDEQGKPLNFIADGRAKSTLIDSLKQPDSNYHAPVGSRVALFGVTELNSDTRYFSAKFARRITTSLKQESVIHAPLKIDTEIRKKMVAGKMQDTLTGIIADIDTFMITAPNQLGSAIESALSDVTIAKTMDDTTRGFMIRHGVKGESGYIHYDSKEYFLRKNETIRDFLKRISQDPQNAPAKDRVDASTFRDITERASFSLTQTGGTVEIVGLTKCLFASFGEKRQILEDHLKKKNYRNTALGSVKASYSMSAIVIDKESKFRKHIKRIFPLPDAKVINDLAAVPSVNVMFSPPKMLIDAPTPLNKVEGLKSVEKEITTMARPSDETVWPLSLTEVRDSKGRFTKVEFTGSPINIGKHRQRILDTLSTDLQAELIDLGSGKGLQFNSQVRPEVEAIFSDLLGTCPVYVSEHKSGNESLMRVRGRFDVPEVRKAVESIITQFPNARMGAFYADVPEEFRFELEDAIAQNIQPLTTEIKTSLLATSRNRKFKFPDYSDWMEERFRNSPQLLMESLSDKIESHAMTAKIDWPATAKNISMPSPDGAHIEYYDSMRDGRAVKASESKYDHKVQVVCSSHLLTTGVKQQSGIDDEGKKREPYLTIRLGFGNRNLQEQGVLDTFYSGTYTWQMYQDERRLALSGKGPSQAELAERQKKAQERAELLEKKRVVEEKRKIEKDLKQAKEALAYHEAVWSELKTGVQPIGYITDKRLHGIENRIEVRSGNWTHKEEKDPIPADYYALTNKYDEFVGYQTLLSRKNSKDNNKIWSWGMPFYDSATKEPLGIKGTIHAVEPLHTVYYCEGFSDGGTISLATNQQVDIGQSKVNMMHVACLHGERYPGTKPIVVADNDIYHKDGNVGVIAALKAAYYLQSEYVVPNLPVGFGKLTDIDDVRLHFGLEEASRQLLNERNTPPRTLLEMHESILSLTSIHKKDGAINDAVKELLESDPQLSAEEIRAKLEAIPPFIPKAVDTSLEHSLNDQQSQVNSQPDNAEKQGQLEPDKQTQNEAVPAKSNIESTASKSTTVQETSVVENEPAEYTWPVSIIKQQSKKPGKQPYLRIINNTDDPSIDSQIESAIESMTGSKAWFIEGIGYTCLAAFENNLKCRLYKLTGAPALYIGKPYDRKNTEAFVIRGAINEPEILSAIQQTIGQIVHDVDMEKEKGVVIYEPTLVQELHNSGDARQDLLSLMLGKYLIPADPSNDITESSKAKLPRLSEEFTDLVERLSNYTGIASSNLITEYSVLRTKEGDFIEQNDFVFTANMSKQLLLALKEHKGQAAFHVAFDNALLSSEEWLQELIHNGVVPAQGPIIERYNESIKFLKARADAPIEAEDKTQEVTKWELLPTAEERVIQSVLFIERHVQNFNVVEWENESSESINFISMEELFMSEGSPYFNTDTNEYLRDQFIKDCLKIPDMDLTPYKSEEIKNPSKLFNSIYTYHAGKRLSNLDLWVADVVENKSVTNSRSLGRYFKMTEVPGVVTANPYLLNGIVNDEIVKFDASLSDQNTVSTKKGLFRQLLEKHQFLQKSYNVAQVDNYYQANSQLQLEDVDLDSYSLTKIVVYTPYGNTVKYGFDVGQTIKVVGNSIDGQTLANNALKKDELIEQFKKDGDSFEIKNTKGIIEPEVIKAEQALGNLIQLEHITLFDKDVFLVKDQEDIICIAKKSSYATTVFSSKVDERLGKLINTEGTRVKEEIVKLDESTGKETRLITVLSTGDKPEKHHFVTDASGITDEIMEGGDFSDVLSQLTNDARTLPIPIWKEDGEHRLYANQEIGVFVFDIPLQNVSTVKAYAEQQYRLALKASQKTETKLESPSFTEGTIIDVVAEHSAIAEEANVALAKKVQTKEEQKPKIEKIEVVERKPRFVALKEQLLELAKEQASYADIYTDYFSKRGLFLSDNPYFDRVKNKVDYEGFKTDLEQAGGTSFEEYYNEILLSLNAKVKDVYQFEKALFLPEKFIETAGGFDGMEQIINTLGDMKSRYVLPTLPSFSKFLELPESIYIPNDILALPLTKNSVGDLSERNTADLLFLADIHCIGLKSGPNDRIEIANEIVAMHQLRNELNAFSVSELTDMGTAELNDISNRLGSEPASNANALAVNIKKHLKRVSASSTTKIAQYAYLAQATKQQRLSNIAKTDIGKIFEANGIEDETLINKIDTRLDRLYISSSLPKHASALNLDTCRHALWSNEKLASMGQTAINEPKHTCNFSYLVSTEDTPSFMQDLPRNEALLEDGGRIVSLPTPLDNSRLNAKLLPINSDSFNYSQQELRLFFEKIDGHLLIQVNEDNKWIIERNSDNLFINKITTDGINSSSLHSFGSSISELYDKAPQLIVDFIEFAQNDFKYDNSINLSYSNKRELLNENINILDNLGSSDIDALFESESVKSILDTHNLAGSVLLEDLKQALVIEDNYVYENSLLTASADTEIANRTERYNELTNLIRGYRQQQVKEVEQNIGTPIGAEIELAVDEALNKIMPTNEDTYTNKVLDFMSEDNEGIIEQSDIFEPVSTVKNDKDVELESGMLVLSNNATYVVDEVQNDNTVTVTPAWEQRLLQHLIHEPEQAHIARVGNDQDNLLVYLTEPSSEQSLAMFQQLIREELPPLFTPDTISDLHRYDPKMKVLIGKLFEIPELSNVNSDDFDDPKVGHILNEKLTAIVSAKAKLLNGKTLPKEREKLITSLLGTTDLEIQTARLGEMLNRHNFNAFMMIKDRAINQAKDFGFDETADYAHVIEKADISFNTTVIEYQRQLLSNTLDDGHKAFLQADTGIRDDILNLLMETNGKFSISSDGYYSFTNNDVTTSLTRSNEDGLLNNLNVENLNVAQSVNAVEVKEIPELAQNELVQIDRTLEAKLGESNEDINKGELNDANTEENTQIHDELSTGNAERINIPGQANGVPSTEGDGVSEGTGKSRERDTSRDTDTEKQLNRRMDDVSRDDGLGVEEARLEENISREIVALKTVEFQLPRDLEQEVSGGVLKRANLNINALKILKQIEQEEREATDEEKEALAKYNGFGGMTPLFTSRDLEFRKLREEYESLLTETELDQLAESATDAFYTPPELYKHAWETMKSAGFEGGKLIEPAVGVGGALGTIPDSLKDKTEFVGVEIENLSASIAKSIYNNQTIHNKGFEDSQFPKNYFDGSLSNIPFGNIKPFDAAYNSNNHVIHDYFFIKTLQIVKPGSVVAFFTSTGTLDKNNGFARMEMARHGVLLGAARFPEGLFKKFSGTDVSVDLLVFKKVSQKQRIEQKNWRDTTGFDASSILDPDYDEIPKDLSINQYFQEHPEHIFGDIGVGTNQYGKHILKFKRNSELTLEDFFNSFNQDIKQAAQQITLDLFVDDEEASDFNPLIEFTTPRRKLFDGDFVVQNDELYNVKEVFNQETEEYDLKLQLNESLDGKPRENVIKQTEITATLSELLFIRANSGQFSTQDWKDTQAILNKLYDEYVSKYGNIKKASNIKLFRDDSRAPKIKALEMQDSTGNYIKTDIFSSEPPKPRPDLYKSDKPEDIVFHLMTTGDLDYDTAQEAFTGPELELKNYWDLNVFFDPAEQKFLTSEIYLSGDIGTKLEIAKKFADSDPAFSRNIEALEGAYPEKVPFEDLDIPINHPVIPVDILKEFILDTLGENNDVFYNVDIKKTRHFSNTHVIHVGGMWHFEIPSSVINSGAENNTVHYGTDALRFSELVQLVANGKEIVVKRKIGDANVIDVPETQLAKQKANQIKLRFKEFIGQTPERRDAIEAAYSKINRFKVTQYDGSKFDFPDINPMYKGSPTVIHPHQQNAYAFAYFNQCGLFKHPPGAGKSIVMMLVAAEHKRRGLCTKTLLAVPNSSFPQMQVDTANFLPNASVLFIDPKGLTKAHRQETISRIATGDWDIVLVPHSVVDKLTVPKDIQATVIEEEIDNLQRAIGASDGEDVSFDTHRGSKNMQARLRNKRASLKRLYNENKKDTLIDISEMGIDMLILDEAQAYLALAPSTNLSHVKGIQSRESQRASNMLYLSRYIQSINNGKGVYWATATDAPNSVQQLWVGMYMVHPNLLRAAGVYDFDDYMNAFTEAKTEVEIAPEGTGYKEETRYSTYVNLPELTRLVRQYADIITPDMLDLDLPIVHRLVMEADKNPVTDEIMQWLAERGALIRQGNTTDISENDNILAVMTEGRKAAIDPRLCSPNAPDLKGSKINNAIIKLAHRYYEEKEQKGTIVFFSEYGVNDTSFGFNLFEDIRSKLVLAGIPEHEIALSSDWKNDTDKVRFQNDFNAGNVRILIGSYHKISVALNMQERISDLAMLSIPWRPDWLEQSIGRGERQGNIYENLNVWFPLQDGSMDKVVLPRVEAKAEHNIQLMLDPETAPRRYDTELDIGYDELKAAVTDDPLFKRLIEVEKELSDKTAIWQGEQNQLNRLQVDKSYYESSLKNSENALKQAKGVLPLFQGQNALTLFNKEVDITKLSKNDEAGNKYMASIGRFVAKEIKKAQKNNNFTADHPNVIGSFGSNKLAIEYTQIDTLQGHKMVWGLSINDTQSDKYIDVSKASIGTGKMFRELLLKENEILVAIDNISERVTSLTDKLTSIGEISIKRSVSREDIALLDSERIELTSQIAELSKEEGDKRSIAYMELDDRLELLVMDPNCELEIQDPNEFREIALKYQEELEEKNSMSLH